MFPSPQGGSETRGGPPPHCAIMGVSIPSRRVGDIHLGGDVRGNYNVSIPSRRVGDFSDEQIEAAAVEVSIPSRRVGDITTT